MQDLNLRAHCAADDVNRIYITMNERESHKCGNKRVALSSFFEIATLGFKIKNNTFFFLSFVLLFLNFLLTRKKKMASSAPPPPTKHDVEVNWEDQQRICAFGRLTSRSHELRAMIASKEVCVLSSFLLICFMC